MNFELADDISSLLLENKLDEAISLAEVKLNEQPVTGFHKLLGKTLLHQSETLVAFFSDFYEKVKGNLKIKAIYAEMNGFTINPDLWFLDLFAYNKVGELDNTDWLADWEEGNSTDKVFPLTGYEELQATYHDFIENERYKETKVDQASEVAELLIVLRLQELVRASTRIAKSKDLPWSKIPVFASAHDYDDLVFKVS